MAVCDILGAAPPLAGHGCSAGRAAGGEWRGGPGSSAARRGGERRGAGTEEGGARGAQGNRPPPRGCGPAGLPAPRRRTRLRAGRMGPGAAGEGREGARGPAHPRARRRAPPRADQTGRGGGGGGATGEREAPPRPRWRMRTQRGRQAEFRVGGAAPAGDGGWIGGRGGGSGVQLLAGAGPVPAPRRETALSPQAPASVKGRRRLFAVERLQVDGSLQLAAAGRSGCCVFVVGALGRPQGRPGRPSAWKDVPPAVTDHPGPWSTCNREPRPPPGAARGRALRSAPAGGPPPPPPARAALDAGQTDPS